MTQDFVALTALPRLPSFEPWVAKLVDSKLLPHMLHFPQQYYMPKMDEHTSDESMYTNNYVALSDVHAVKRKNDTQGRIHVHV